MKSKKRRAFCVVDIQDIHFTTDARVDAMMFASGRGVEAIVVEVSPKLSPLGASDRYSMIRRLLKKKLKNTQRQRKGKAG